MITSTGLNNRSLNVSTSGVNPSSSGKILEFNGSRYLFKLDFSKSFQENSATEQKFPSVSTAKGTTTEDGDLPFSHALSWQRLYFRNLVLVALKSDC